MRQVLIRKDGTVVVEEVPAPALGPGEILVDVASSVISTGTETGGLAGGDLRSRVETALRLARLGAARLREAGLEETLRKVKARDGVKGATGYSVAGIVREVGGAISDLRPGDRVAAGGSDYAHHAETIVAPRNLVVRVPDEVSLRAASFATLGAVALQGVRRAAPQVGETVVVVGLGLVGQLAVQILGASGCRVVGVDGRPDRTELARSGPRPPVALCGADPAEVERCVDAVTRGRGADAVLLCAGTPSSGPANLALRIVRQRGRVVVVGAVGMELDRADFYRKEVEFTISCSYGPGRYDPSYEEGGLDYPLAFARWTENRNFEAFLDLVARGQVDPEGLIAAEYPLEQAPKAFATARAGEGSGVAHVLRYPREDTPLRRTVATAPERRPRSAGTIDVAVIGAGSFARSTLLPGILAEPGLGLRTVVARTGASAARLGHEFGAARLSTDVEETLADPEVDAVVIATRHDSHADLAARALRSGKHVFLEKPMGIAREPLEALRAEAQASDRVFTVGYNRRYAPLSGVLREARLAHPGPCVVDYRVNAGAVDSGHWTLDPAVGGGRIVGEVCHFIDLLRFWLGSEVLEWHAAGVAAGESGPPSVQDVSVSLRFRDEAGRESVASLVYSSVGSPELAKERAELHVGGGTVVLDDFRALEVHGLAGSATRSRRSSKGHREQLHAFRLAVQGRPSPLLGLEDAYAAADLALRIDESLRAGR